MPISPLELDEAVTLSEQNPNDLELAQAAITIADAYQRELGKRQDATRKLFTDREKHGLPDETLTDIAKIYNGDTDQKYRLFNKRFFREFGGMADEQIDALGPSLRKQYSLKEWGEEVIDDKAFADRLGQEFDFEDEIGIRAQEAALKGAASWEADAALDFDYLEDPRYKGKEKKRQEQFKAAFQNVKGQLAGLEPTANVFVEQLKTAMGVGEGTGGTALPDQWFLDTAMEIPKDKRDLFLATVAARAGEGEQKTLFQAMAERMGRGATDIVRQSNAAAKMENLDRLARHVVANGGVSELPQEFGFDPTTYLTGYLGSPEARDRAGKVKVPAPDSEEFKALSPEQQAALSRISQEQDFTMLYKKVNDIATGAVDPAKGSNYYASGLIGVAGMAPNLALMATGPVGTAVNVRGYQAAAMMDYLEANPGVDTQTASRITQATGIGQGLLDYVPTKIIGGRLPLFSKWLEKATLTKGGLVGRASARVVGGAVFEAGQEFAQDVLVPGAVEELAGVLKADMPGVNWDARLAGFTSDESLAELVPSIIMLSLIGGGVGGVRDYKNGWQLVSDRRLLVGAGISEAEADAIVEAAEKQDATGAETLLRQSFAKIDAGPVSEVLPEARKAAAASIIQDAEKRAEAIAKGEASGVLPAIGRTTEGWSLRFNDGTTRAFPSHQEADAARWNYASEQGLSIADATRSVIQSVESQLEAGREVAFTFSDQRRTLLDATKEGEVSREGATRRAGIAEEIGGQVTPEAETEIDPEQEYQEAFTAAELQAIAEDDKLALYQILGSNKTEFADGVQRTTIKLFQGATPLTVIEEKLEGDATLMLANNRRDWMLTSLRRYERMSGDKILPRLDAEVTDSHLKEAWSHLGQSYFVGRSRKGDVGDMWKSRDFRSQAAKLARTPLGAAMDGYARFFNAVWKRAAKLNKLRRSGALDADLERELARSVGFGEQQEYESAVEAQAAQNRQMLEDAGFEAEPEGVTIAEATDEAPFSVIERGEGYKKTEFADGMTLEGPASFSVIAYHGTPHKVDKFSLDKIGTGEGAQAYGWGLYFADSRDVADSYRKGLSAEFETPNGRVKFDALDFTDEGVASDWLNRANGDFDTAIRLQGEFMATIAENSRRIPKENRIGEILLKWKSDNWKWVEPPGNLYTVSLLPNEDEFLAWDLPLAKQSDRIREALPLIGVKSRGSRYDWKPTVTMREAYRQIAADFESDKTASQELLAIGIQGIRFLDGNSRADGTGTYNYVIFDDSLVRILEENGQPVTDEPSFSVITNATDSAYLAAVKSGDMETAQRMVDDAARAAGYDVGPVYHGTVSEFNSFDNKKAGRNDRGLWGLGHYFANSLERANSYADRQGDGARVIAAFISLKNPLVLKTGSDLVIRLPDGTNTRDLVGPNLDGSKIKNIALDGGHDGVVQFKPNGEIGDLVVYSPNQIKSADPVTYDESGNPIPLSQRFNPARDEITYSVITNAESRIADSFNPFFRNPEQRRKILLEAQRRSAEQAREWQAIIRANRPNADIERERKEREGELFNEKLDTLSSGEIQALDNANLLEDNSLQPILSELLNEKTRTTKTGKKVRYWSGSLMSKTEAKRRGYSMGGEWDAVPEGLPPYVWGGTITPDQAATMFGFDSPEAFFDALSAEIQSRADRKREVEGAYKRVRELEREAKRESHEWAAEQRKLRQTVGTDRATLIGAMRTLDAMVSALPSEIRGKIGGMVRLAQFKTPAAMMAELERRSAKLDETLEDWLREEADKALKKLFKIAVPAKDESGKLRKGKAGANIHDLFDKLREVHKQRWTREMAEAHAVGLEAEIAKGEMSPEREAHALMEAEAVRLIGGWYDQYEDSGKKNKKGGKISVRVKGGDGLGAQARNHAVDTLTDIWTKAYHDFKKQKAAEKERRDGIRADLRADTGKAGKKSERALAELAGVTLPGKAKDFFLSLLNFEQLTAWAFGKDSKWAQWFADQQRKAENAKLDAVQSVVEGVEDLFTEMAGGKFKGEQLQFRMMQRSLTATAANGDVVPLSELEAISALLMWQQEDGKRHLKGRRDEYGNLTSEWSYDEDFIDEISGKLSPEAWKVLSYLQTEYGKEYEPLNAVYRDIYGINLPRNPNYSPLLVKPQQASAGQTQDPLTGSTVSAGSFTPGSLRTRAQISAEPDFRDAVATFIAHKKQIEHWKANARFVLDSNAVLGNRELGNSIEAAHGQEAVKIIRKWLDAIAQGGVRDAAAGIAAMKTFEKMTGRAASMALVGRIGTLAVQATQLGAAAALMPTGAYVTRLGKLLSGNLGWGKALASPYVQRRLAQQPVMVQAAMEGLKAGKPTQLKHQVRRIGQLLNGADALFTAGTFAMVHDYHFREAVRGGMTEAEADVYASETAERVVESVAQPTRMGTRSFFEVSSSNPGWRLAWAFASDARKNAALLGFNWAKGSATDKYRAMLFVIGLNGLIGNVIRSAWRDLRDDEDEEAFDERYWSPKRMALGTMTDWLYGFPVVGEEVQRAIFAAAGEYNPDGGLFSAAKDAVGPVMRTPENLESVLSGDFGQPLRDAEKIMTAIGLGSDATAAATSVMHIVRDIYGLGENFLGD